MDLIAFALNIWVLTKHAENNHWSCPWILMYSFIILVWLEVDHFHLLDFRIIYSYIYDLFHLFIYSITIHNCPGWLQIVSCYVFEFKTIYYLCICLFVLIIYFICFSISLIFNYLFIYKFIFKYSTLVWLVAEHFIYIYKLYIYI